MAGSRKHFSGSRPSAACFRERSRCSAAERSAAALDLFGGLIRQPTPTESRPLRPGLCGTAWYDGSMAHDQPTDISIRQLVADSGSVTRGLRRGRTYTLTLNGEPLARMVPIRRRRAVPKDEVLAIFATAPVLDADDLRADLDEAVSQDVRDPYEGTGL
jgi:antitoxin (DNA-binding transcriptional repressor) of toxin-antitoxin stability system